MTALLAMVDAASTPILALLVWLVWRIRENDLKHIEASIAELSERVARLEGPR